MQNDAINYEHCVREYYQPIVEDFTYIGLRLLKAKLGRSLGPSLERISCFKNNNDDNDNKRYNKACVCNVDLTNN